jgi:hypothetical protein
VIITIICTLTPTITSETTNTPVQKQKIEIAPKYVFKPAPIDVSFYEKAPSKTLQILKQMGVANGVSQTHQMQMLNLKNKINQEIKQNKENSSPTYISLANDEYYNTPIIELTCIQHMKMMRLGYSCVDSKSISPEEREYLVPDDIEENRYTPIFVVMKNYKKYFMVIMDSKYDLEVGIYKHLPNNSIGLELLEYKIIDSRFVGIYTYLPHTSTLRYHIKSGQMTFFDQLFVMKQMTKYAIDFFNEFEPRNNLLTLNLLSGNLLVTKESFYKLRLIRYIRGSVREYTQIIQPEKKDLTNKINQRSSIVYLLGYMFYFILFGIDPPKGSIDDTPIFQEYNAKLYLEKFPHVNNSLMEMIRGMMNSNPIDRVSLEYVNTKLEENLKASMTLEYEFKLYMSEITMDMDHEIRTEYVVHEEKMRAKYKDSQINGQVKDKKNGNSTSIQNRYENEIAKADPLRISFLKWIGRAERCYFKETQNQVNFLNDYGLIPVDKSSITSYRGLSDDGGHAEAHDHAHDSHEEHENLEEMRIEFILLILFLLFIIGIVSTYFALKDKEIVMYLKEDFPAKLVLN